MIFQNITFYTLTLFLGIFLGLVLLMLHFSSLFSRMKAQYPLLLGNSKTLIQLYLLSFIILMLSLSLLGPAVYKKSGEVAVNGLDILVILDVSKSMNAYDFSDGNSDYSRIDVAKSILRNIIIENPENRYGLVVFAGEAVSVSPLTSDSQIFLNFLSGVDYRNVNMQGTNLEEAYSIGISRFLDNEEYGKALLLLSDGGDEDDTTDISEIKKLFKDTGIAHSVIGIGTEQGERIVTGRDIFGTLSFQQFNGEDVITQLNTDKLEELASIEGGTYYEISELEQVSDISSIFSEIEKKSILQSGGKNALDLSRYIAFFVFIAFAIYLLSPLFRTRHVETDTED